APRALPSFPTRRSSDLEGAVALVLPRHQRGSLPGGGENRDAPAACALDVGAKATGLHRHRAEGETNRRDVAIGPDPGPAADLPRSEEHTSELQSRGHLV